MFAVVLLGLIAAPLIAIGAAFLRALVLFWPTMLLLGAVHSHIPAIPSLGWQATFLVVALISLLVPVATSSSSSKS
jgi:hypothetical protein